MDRNSREWAGLTLGQIQALCYIEGAGGEATISEIAASLSRVNHTVTGIVDHLEREGLAIRRRDLSEDRRKVWVAITPAGTERVNAFRSHLPDLFPRMFDVSGPNNGPLIKQAADTLANLLLV